MTFQNTLSESGSIYKMMVAMEDIKDKSKFMYLASISFLIGKFHLIIALLPLLLHYIEGILVFISKAVCFVRGLKSFPFHASYTVLLYP